MLHFVKLFFLEKE